MRMKSIFGFLIVGLTVVTVACGTAEEKSGEVSTDIINDPATAAGEQNDQDVPALEFEEDVIDFGEISQGEKVMRRFKFTNTGNSDLIISDAKGSCGCTVPRWPKQPIRPGQAGEIEVVFDSNGKQGRQHKTVTLIANTKPNTTVIALKGDVNVPEK